MGAPLSSKEGDVGKLGGAETWRGVEFWGNDADGIFTPLLVMWEEESSVSKFAFCRRVLCSRNSVSDILRANKKQSALDNCR